VLSGLLAWAGLKGSYHFLAVNDPHPGGILVIEGWAPDYALEAVKDEFKRHPYSKLYVTGGPIEAGAPLSEYNSYAELGAAVLLKIGLPTNSVQAVPAPWVRQDRTYTCAKALRWWLATNGVPATNINLITVGPHSRRSRLLFQKAFGSTTTMGVTAVPPREYDPHEWWRSSPGFRTVTGEQIAYIYVRLFFRTTKEQ
jgi:uncharacterized SAM-binding protein YcdF (DUF218 family)